MKFTVDPNMHMEGCAFRKAVESPVGIECEHNFDVCPYCDPCSCGREVKEGNSLPTSVPVAPGEPCFPTDHLPESTDTALRGRVKELEAELSESEEKREGWARGFGRLQGEFDAVALAATGEHGRFCAFRRNGETCNCGFINEGANPSVQAVHDLRLRSKALEEIVERAAYLCAGSGCGTGDCPHGTNRECYLAMIGFMEEFEKEAAAALLVAAPAPEPVEETIYHHGKPISGPGCTRNPNLPDPEPESKEEG